MNRRKKRELLNAHINEVENNRRNRRTREQYKGVSEVRKGYQPRSNMVRDKNGNMLVNEEQIKDRWKEYFSELLNRPDPEEPVENVEEMNEEEVQGWTDIEVRAAINRLKNHKAAGTDGIVAELLKHGGNELLDEVVRQFMRIWEEERMPDEWEKGIYLPLHKKDDRAACKNYRGLCLLNIGYKIFSILLCGKLLPHYETIIGDYQAGFMPSKSTIDNIFLLRQINEKYREYARTSWHIFIDYTQAYDSIHRDSLWSILREFNIPEKIIRMIRLCYNNSKGMVRVGGELTDVFQVETGLRQGCPLSCMLFNIALEWVMRNTPHENDMIAFRNGFKCDRLAYADDSDLMGESYEGRDTQLTNFNSCGVRVGLSISEPKTKAMKASREERTEDFIDLGNFLLEEVDTFRYLGSIVSSDNTMDHEIAARISAASKCSWALKDLLHSKLLSRATKLDLYRTSIRPVATYGCEAWALTQEQERRLLVFENGILRRIYGAVRDEVTGEWRRRHNRELRDLSRLPLITGFVSAQRLRWAGHVARMPPGSMLRLAMDGVPEGRRPVGRPRMRWEDCIRKDLQQLGVNDPVQWRHIAQDRAEWRRLVSAAKVHGGLQLPE